MAGIGIRLNKIFDKHTLTSSIYGIGFSIVYTIMPMIIVILTLFLMYKILDFNTVSYIERELFSSTVLYIFVFSLLTSSPFNSVLSKFQTDRIYERRYEDIRPCIYIGTISNLTFSSIVAIPFYLFAVIVGEIPVYYVFTSYMAYLALTLTFSTMLYNSVLKQYKKISIYFFISMLISFFLSIFFNKIIQFSVSYSMLLSLAIGFLLIASLELSNVLRFFPSNSYRYKDVLIYYKKYWKLIVSNFYIPLAYLYITLFFGQSRGI